MDNCKENSRIMENYFNQEKYILHISDNYSFYSMHKTFDYYPCNECKPKLRIGNIRECINEIDDDIESLKCSNSIGTSKSKISVLSTLISISSSTLAILLIIFILHKVKCNKLNIYINNIIIISINIYDNEYIIM